MKLLTLSTLLLVFLSIPSFSEELNEHKNHKMLGGVEALSQELRALLSEEMIALQTGMTSIIPAFISGDWENIESTAKKMKNSYILKQSLTRKQIEELNKKLPHEFSAMDQNFHYLAGMLEHAAQSKKPELVNFYFSEMNESCLKCHAKFATHRFQALRTQQASEHTH